MDTLTHIALGACIGELIAGKQLGRKAVIIGAVAQNLPDIDFIASAWLPVSADLLAHRGITHSILFVCIAAPVLALLFHRLTRISSMTTVRWMCFFAVQLFVHIFIDAFNAYGTGWFEPFSHYRVSFDALYVADVLLITPLLIAAIALVIPRRANRKRKWWAGIALGWVVFYIILAITIKVSVGNTIKDGLARKGVTVSNVVTTPTPLNNLLWYVIVPSDSGYWLGYRSVFDTCADISFRYVSRNDSLLAQVSDRVCLNRLLRFSRGYYTVELENDTLVFNDMLFGEMQGWRPNHYRFVCHYYLQYPGANNMVVQRGRFEGWNKQAILIFLKRIAGGCQS